MPKTNSAPLPPLESHRAIAPTEYLDAYSLAMDQALGVEKTSLAAVTQFNAQAMEWAWEFTPVLCNLFGVAMRSFAGCLQWSQYMMGMPCPGAESALPRLAAATGMVIEGDGAESRHEADPLALAMDAAIGAAESVEPEMEMFAEGPVLQALEERLPPVRGVQSMAEDEEELSLAMGSVA